MVVFFQLQSIFIKPPYIYIKKYFVNSVIVYKLNFYDMMLRPAYGFIVYCKCIYCFYTFLITISNRFKNTLFCH